MIQKTESPLGALARRLRETPPQTLEEYEAFCELLKPHVTLRQLGSLFGGEVLAPNEVRTDLDAILDTTLASLLEMFGSAENFARFMRHKLDVRNLEMLFLQRIIHSPPAI